MNAQTLNVRSVLVNGLRLIPAALLLGAVAVNAPATSATGCYPAGGATAVHGGNVRNETDLDLKANGGRARADASGGNRNAAFAGPFGDAEAGNGGIASADANGGKIKVGKVNSGKNRGNHIFVDDSGYGCWYPDCDDVVVHGGNVSNETDIDAEANGGEAAADASGGDGNLAAAGWFGDAEAGNGGYADADANGGEIEIGDVNSGANEGNEILVDC